VVFKPISQFPNFHPVQSLNELRIEKLRMNGSASNIATAIDTATATD